MIQEKPILGVILARGGSKGVPGKNIKPILGTPLIAYTIVESLRSKYIDKLIVSTNDQEIADVSRRYGADVPFLRPETLSSDTATSKAALQHAVHYLEKTGKSYDYIIELMVTNPLKTAFDIDACLEKLHATGADSVIGVVRLDDHHPARAKRIIDDKLLDYCVPEPNESRRQDLEPKAYIRNGSIYSMKRDVLMIEDYRYGTENSRPYIFPSERSVNVDTLEDFYIAEMQLRKLSTASCV